MTEGDKTMTYDEKVRLFNAKRYLMPLPPLGTKNWTTRDFIRFIDQHGRWCPSGRDACELNDENTRNTASLSSNGMQV